MRYDLSVKNPVIHVYGEHRRFIITLATFLSMADQGFRQVLLLKKLAITPRVKNGEFEIGDVIMIVRSSVIHVTKVMILPGRKSGYLTLDVQAILVSERNVIVLQMLFIRYLREIIL